MSPATGLRSVRVGGVSFALAEPTTAAATAVASAAAHSSSFCLSKFVAVVLGYAVLAGSLFRSLPQILKVLQHQSTEGLSLTSYVVELCCYSISIAYNISQGYGFNTFGEVVACWLQDIILIALIFRFSRTKKRVAAATGAAVALGCAWLLSPCCPMQVLAVLQASNILTMALGSRLPQIILNMRRGNAGVLSVMTCLLNVAGNTARIFTTVVLTGDMLLMAGYLSQGMLNTVLLCQSISTARQDHRTVNSSNNGNAVEEFAAQTQSQRLQPEGKPQELGSAGPDSGLGEPGSLIMQPAS
jgi:mannose-P-dolichol utilization defect protein 1